MAKMDVFMTILVVEDDEICVQLIVETLEMESYTVRLARDGMEGLALLEKYKDIELVLLDRMMPRMDGLTFIKEAKAQNLLADVPVVIYTRLIKAARWTRSAKS